MDHSVYKNGIAVRQISKYLFLNKRLTSINKKMQIDTTTEVVVMPFALVIKVSPIAANKRTITSNSILFLFL